MLRILRMLMCGIFTCSSLASPAWAEATGAEELFFNNIPVVFAASKKEESQVKAPATTLVVTQEEIRERGYRNLKDVLADLPGMETMDYYWSEIGTLVPVRGIVGNNKIILLVNGTRVNPPGGENLMLRDDQSVRYAKRVEIVYGPGAALYGADAVSLVVNIVTINAEDKVKNVNVSYGQNQTMEASGGYSGKVGNLGVTAYAQGYDSEGTNYENEYSDWFRGHKAAWQSSTATTGEAKAYNRWSQGFNGYVDLASDNSSLQSWVRWSDRSSAHGDSDGQAFSEIAHWRDFTYLVKGQNKVEVTENVSLTNTLSYNMYQIDPATRYVVPVTNYNNWKYGRSVSTELESLLNWTLSKWDVTLGVSAADFEVVPKATFPGGFKSDEDLLKQDTPFIYYDTQVDAIADTNRREIPRVVEGKYQRYALFGDTRWHATGKLDLVLGGRYDVDSRGSYDNVFNARGSAIYTMSDNLTLKYIVGQAYVVPAMYFRYETYQSGTNRLNHSFGDLDPERALTNEINLVHHTDHWYNNLSLYYNTQSDLLHAAHDKKPENIERTVYVGAGVGTPIDLTHNINLGKSKTYGVDLYSKYRFTGSKNSVFAGLSWVDAEYEKKGVKTGLDIISDKHVRVGGTWYMGNRFFISPRFTWDSNPKLGNGQPAYKDTTTSSLYQAAILRDIYQLDLYANYKVTEKMDVFTRVNNLTNNKYGKRGVGAGRSGPAELFQAELGFIFNF